MECTADDLVTANDDLAAWSLRNVADIIAGDVGTSQIEVSNSDDEDNGNSCGHQPLTAAETMHALGGLQHMVASKTVRGDTSAWFFSFQNSQLADLAEKKVQSDIQQFFTRKYRMAHFCTRFLRIGDERAFFLCSR